MKGWEMARTTDERPALLLEEVFLGGVNRGFGPVGDARFGVNVGQVTGNGVDTDEKFLIQQ